MVSKSNEEKVQSLLIDLQQPTISAETARIAAEYISNLYDELIVGARCICCDEVEECVDECTFAEDCPEEAGHMAYIRGVLKVPG